MATTAKSGMTWSDFRAKVLDPKATTAQLLVFEPTVDWNVTLFQRPQHMAMALGRKGCTVLYRTTEQLPGEVLQAAPNVWLVNTPRVTELKGAIWSFYSTSSICSPEQMADRKKTGRIVYEYIDHIDSAISGGKSEIQRLHALKTAALTGLADYLIGSAHNLCAELSAEGPHAPVAYIPNGVDVAHFQNAGHDETTISDRFLKFRNKYRRIVGYYGAIAPWLWYDIMSQLAAQLPEVGFVYIGPDYGGCSRSLPRSENVLNLGPVAYDQLPAYARRFDVCFIPFSPGPIARATSPLKLFEYFAMQKPVVVTADMDECKQFPEVFSGSDLLSLTEAIEKAFFAAGSASYRESTLRLAYENSWNVRAESYLGLINENNFA